MLNRCLDRRQQKGDAVIIEVQDELGETEVDESVLRPAHSNSEYVYDIN